MKGLSKKEINMVSFLELNEKFFFTRDDIRQFFKNENEMGVYIHRLVKKNRIIKLSKEKYYLVPVRAFGNHWSEHPFIIVDEIFDGNDYYIGGMAAAHHWGLIEQIPTQIEVYCTKKQGSLKVFNFVIVFKRVRSLDGKDFVRLETKGHGFWIASKRAIGKWLKSR